MYRLFRPVIASFCFLALLVAPMGMNDLYADRDKKGRDGGGKSWRGGDFSKSHVSRSFRGGDDRGHRNYIGKSWRGGDDYKWRGKKWDRDDRYSNKYYRHHKYRDWDRDYYSYRYRPYYYNYYNVYPYYYSYYPYPYYYNYYSYPYADYYYGNGAGLYFYIQ